MRQKILDAVVDNILKMPLDRTLRIAVDGVDGVGKTTFANEIAEILKRQGRQIIRASVDDFHNPKAVRYRLGRHSPEGFYQDSYNYADLRSALLDPLSPGGSGTYRTATFDHLTDAPVRVPYHSAESSSILILDGIFLHRRELRHYWDYSIFLHAPFEVSIPRGARRGKDYGSSDPGAASNQRYIAGQEHYLRECTPQRLATVSIDNSNLEAPLQLEPYG